MRPAHTTIFERINKALQAQYADIVDERLPERWVDLIRYLNEMERKESEAPQPETEPRGRRSSRSH